MAKPYRGRSLWNRENRGRGTCPVCKRTGIKLLYPRNISGQTVNVCKHCRAQKRM